MLWDKDYLPIETEEYADFLKFGQWIRELNLTADGNVFVVGQASYADYETPFVNTAIWVMKIDTAGNFIAPLNISINAENNLLYLGDSTQVNISVESVTGCYTENLSGNGIDFIAEDTQGTSYFHALETGTYNLVYTINDDAGQTEEQTITIIVEEDTGTENLLLSKVQVYPNPVQSFAYFYFAPQIISEDLRLYNSEGKVVKQFLFEAFTEEYKADLSNLSSGVYFWKLGNEMGKILVE